MHGGALPGTSRSGKAWILFTYFSTAMTHTRLAVRLIRQHAKEICKRETQNRLLRYAGFNVKTAKFWRHSYTLSTNIAAVKAAKNGFV